MNEQTLRGAFCDPAKMSVLTERLEAHVKIARDANLTKVTLFTDLLAEAADLIAALTRTAEPREDVVERVARAICKANGVNPDKPDYYGDPLWRSWLPSARAALSALPAQGEPLPDPPLSED